MIFRPTENNQNTRIASAIVTLRREEGEEYEMMSGYGAPVECAGLISNSFTKARQAVLAAEGVTAEEWNTRLDELGMSRFAHFNQLYIQEPRVLRTRYS